MTLFSKRQRAMLLDGALEDHGTYLDGSYRGYYIVINRVFNRRGGLLITISAHSENDPGNANLNTLVQNIRVGHKPVQEAYTGANSVNLLLIPATHKGFVKLANELVPQIADFLTVNSYTTGCSQCGSTEDVACYNINGENLYICKDCLASIEEDLIRNQEEKKSSKSKFLPGILGALLGAVTGAIIYVLIMKLGYIAAICGLIMAFLALTLYEKFGGCLDAKGIVGCILILAVMVYLATKFYWSWDAYDALKEYNWNFGDCFSQLGYILEQLGLKGEFAKDLGMGYLFTIIGSVGKFIGAFRSSTGKYSIKKNAPKA